MALDSRFTTSILIFKLTKIDKSRNMENPDSVTMSGPKRIYQDAQSTVLSDLTMTFKKKRKCTAGVQHKVIYHHYAERSLDTTNHET